MFDELLENPAFWILGGGGITAEILGYVLAKKMGWELIPFWQLLALMGGTLIIAAFFATRE
jgi:hypothetical protein